LVSLCLVCFSLDGQGVASGEAVTVDPLSYAGRGEDDSAYDFPARDPREAILCRTADKGHPNGASEWVACDLAGGGAELRIDWKADHLVGSFGSFKF